MARGVIGWLGAALVACLVVGAVYLPPRGMPRWAWGSPRPLPEATSARVMANQLAGQWRRAQAAAIGARFRGQLGPALTLRRSQDRPGPLLVVQAPDSVRDWAERVIQGALDSSWARLGIGVSKVSVAVVLGRRGPVRPSPITVGTSGGDVAYVLPDSTDRSTCVVTARLPYFAQSRRYMRQDQLLYWAAATLGPCAFYARFGVPSQQVQQWLGRRNFDVAVSAGWFRESRAAQMLPWLVMDYRDRRWWWGNIYSFPFSTMACFAGRGEACRRGLAAGDADLLTPTARIVVPSDPWDIRKIRLIGAEWFLSDVARAAGEDRFQDFWTTSLPVDSALTLALHRPVGEWMVAWERRMSPPPPFGAAVRPLDALLGVALALLVVGLVMAGQLRREVR